MHFNDKLTREILKETNSDHFDWSINISTLKVRSHSAAAAAMLLPQQPESVHTVRLQLPYIFK